MKTRQKYSIMSTDFLSLNKNPVVAALLAFFLGILGAHRFYMRRYVSGIIIAVITVTACASSFVPLILMMVIFLLLSIGEGISYLVMIPKVAKIKRYWNMSPTYKLTP